MEWEEYGQKFELGKEPIFEKRVLTFMARNAQKCMPFSHASTFSIFLTILLHVGAFGEQLEFFLCLSFHVFGCWLHFSHGWEVVFGSSRDWVVFLTFWELLVHFSIHVFVVSCVFTMAVKGHSRFWLSHQLLISRTDYLGCFFPAVSCAH